ncbi:MAG: type VI secretion system tube protein Hcp [Telluria sp.]
MAVDMFLKIDDVKGESQDSKHKDEIDVIDWSWEMDTSATTQAGGGGGSGKVNVENLTVTKWVDKSSPNLMLATCSGKHYKEALLTVRKAGEKPLEYIKVTMKKVLVASVKTGAKGGQDRLTETITLNFGEFKVEYTPQKQDGTGDAVVEAGWNIAGNAPL